MTKITIYIFFLLYTTYSFAQKANVIDYLPENYVENASVDYTSDVQKAIDKNSVIVFPNFPILINDNGLSLRSNQQLIFKKQSKLILKSSDKGKYALIHVKNIKNVKICDANLIGDKFNHNGDEGQWGMGVDIRNSQNIEIKNPQISKFWGDGIYIAGKTTNDIKIIGGVLDNNRRNGISIISGDNILIKDILILNTHGHYPMSAIDIEPNDPERDFLGTIKIQNLHSKNNLRGISIVLNNYLSSISKEINISILNFTSISDNLGVKINGLTKTTWNGKKTKTLKGNIIFENTLIENSKEKPILIKGNSLDYMLSPSFIFKNLETDNLKAIEKIKNKAKTHKFHFKE